MTVTWAQFTAFLKSHSNLDGTNPPNLYSIPDKNSKPEVRGGKYYIPPEDHDAFLNYYVECCLKPNRPAGFTEVQYVNEGPIVVDMDLNFAITQVERVMTQAHVEAVLEAYLRALPKLFQFNEFEKVRAYYCQREHTAIDTGGNRVKDGMHFLFTIHSTAKDTCQLREMTMPDIEAAFRDMPLTNSIDTICDIDIAKKNRAWQMYGSKKAGYAPYLLHQIYEIEWNAEEAKLTWTSLPLDTLPANSVERVRALSARNLDIPFFAYTNDWIQRIEEMEEEEKEKAESRRIMNHGLTGSDAQRSRPMESAFECMANAQLVFMIHDHNHLTEYINTLIERWEEAGKNSFVDLYKYTMALSEDYYGSSSFVKWLSVGWALKVTHEQMFIVWVAMSAKWADFQFDSLPDMLSRWNGAKPSGYTAGSIKYWLNEENPEAYKKIYSASATNRINKLICSNGSTDPCGDVDQARLLFDLYGDFHVCVSIKNNKWCAYEDGRWIIDEEGSKLRNKINFIHSKFIEHEISLKLQQTAIGMSMTALQNPKDKNPEYEKLQKTITEIQRAAKTLNESGKRNHIMAECKQLFFQSRFLDKLDTKTKLFCCANGVVDIDKKIFRPGRPDDYISTSCLRNYDASLLNEATNGVILGQIRQFFKEIYPNEDTREYVWDFLASVLVGDACTTFHIFWGEGSNGKTKIFELMTMAMGEFSHTVPISLIVNERAKVGQASPEVVELRAKRWGTMFEPSQNTVVEEGPFKQVTGGDPLTGRSLYIGDTVTFKPQITIAVCSNYDLAFRTTDHGTWRRVRKIPHLATFTETALDPRVKHQVKADLMISEKFESWLDTFVTMLVHRAFLTGGRIQMRETIRLASAKMRQGQDQIAEFVDSHVVSIPPAEVGADLGTGLGEFVGFGGITRKQITAEYTDWLKETYGGTVRKTDVTNLHNYVTKQFGEFSPATASWHGIRLTGGNRELDLNQFTASDREA